VSGPYDDSYEAFVQRHHEGKAVYSTKRRAKIAAKHARRFDTGKLDAYRCGVCGYWHIGHPKGEGTGLRRWDHTDELTA